MENADQVTRNVTPHSDRTKVQLPEHRIPSTLLATRNGSRMKRSGASPTRMQTLSFLVLALLLVLSGCASRPVNPPITHVNPNAGYRFITRPQYSTDSENLVILAFSGGGTRAAAFSYGVLEFLRDTQVVGPKGGKARLLDHVGAITGVSGGSFTALAYGLYGDKLFDDYEQRFLKRNVQREILLRSLNPIYWPSLSSRGWGRSELAADLYDEILFNGATFADLNRGLLHREPKQSLCIPNFNAASLLRQNRQSCARPPTVVAAVQSPFSLPPV
jgi:predicted acylesterase/phospholipase RssA